MQEGPKLIYNVATGKWLLQVQEDFWTFRSTSDALIIAGYLQVNVVDQSSSDYSDGARGEAYVVEDLDFKCQVSFKPTQPDDKPLSIMVHPEKADFGILDCYRGFHADLWVETHASIIVENIRTLGLRFYLPKNETLGPKTLSFFNGAKEFETATIIRGHPTEIWLDFGESNDVAQEISLNSSAPETSTDDERDLGMIFVDFNIDLTGWTPAEELL